MRVLIIAWMLCVVPLAAAAKPSRVLSEEFKGERWQMVAQLGAEVSRATRCPPPFTPDCRQTRKPKIKKHSPRHERVAMAPPPMTVIVPLPRVRPEPMDDEQAAAYRVIAELLASGKVYVRPAPPKPLNIFAGFKRELVRAGRTDRKLAGVTAPLAAMARRLMDECGASVISGVRKTYVRGSGRQSLHWTGHAVDIVGNPKCLYATLAKAKWPGGMSTDYAAVRHVHLSYLKGGREWGTRFAHYRGGVKRTRYARHRGQRYASAR